MTLVPFGRRLTDLADAAPDRPAVTCGEEQVTRRGLDERANALARDLAARGVAAGDMVTIALPNSVDWFVAVAAAWKLGAVPQPVSAALPAPELRAIVELARPAVVLGVGAGAGDDGSGTDDDGGRGDGAGVAALVGDRPALPVGYRSPAGTDTSPLPDAVSPAWKAPTSGGSTGRPKLIVSGEPSLVDVDGRVPLALRPDGCTVMPGPMYHNGPIVWACNALLWGNHVVVLPRFGASATLAAIEAHRGDVVYLVPTMMKRIWRLPEAERDRYDLSSLRVVWHLAEPCPPWLKRAWVDWLGPERVYELYGGTEGTVATVIRGDEWLERPGSVGRPIVGELQVCDAGGEPVPPGVPGEVWMRRSGDGGPTYRYVGAEARTRPGGWESLGDNGHLDADGYLYLGDRISDMILTGGANVYPAEVEAALAEHPAVRSAAVIGLPDEDLGNRVHAVVEAGPDDVTVDELLAFVGERLARYKVPRSAELVDVALRDDAGKVRRSALRAERLPASRQAQAGP